MCIKGSWGDNKPLEFGLKAAVSCRDNEGVKERPEKEAGCWYAERAEEEEKEAEPGRAPEIKSSVGAGLCIATGHKIDIQWIAAVHIQHIGSSQTRDLASLCRDQSLFLDTTSFRSNDLLVALGLFLSFCQLRRHSP